MHHDALKVHVGVCKQKGSVTGKGALTTRGRTKSVPFRRAVCSLYPFEGHSFIANEACEVVALPEPTCPFWR